MRRRSKYCFGALLAVAGLCPSLVGCGQSNDGSVAEKPATETTAAKDDDDTQANPGEAANVVRDFLNAIKSGDETVSNELLTPLARQKTGELNMAVAPMGSESASFTVGEVELPEEGAGDVAHVMSTWTDIDDDGQERTDEILWVLRREEEGWRIGGMATKIFPDQEPLLLDFENPEDMQRKQQLAEAEMERRAREAVAEEPDDGTTDQDADETAAVSKGDERHAVRPTRPTRSK
ncbi:MAG TPA: hypothetical protein VHC22_04100 [Pirellulales bacterium]|nr:hypothetical protein [Pirellulales bacterium]